MSDSRSPHLPPIILVHGFRGAPSGLSDIAHLLRAAGYTVFVPPIPPCTESTNYQIPPSHNVSFNQSSYSAQYYTEYLIDFIKLNHIEHPILIGHSMGSIICAATAHQYPDLLHKKIILLSPIAGHTPKLFALISPLSAICPRRLVDYCTTRYLLISHDRHLLRSILVATNQCSLSQDPDRKNNLAAARFAAHHSVDDFLPISKDILLLAGAKDRLVSQQKTLALTHVLQQSPQTTAKAQFLPNTGHLHNYEQPQETVDTILRFLKT